MHLLRETIYSALCESSVTRFVRTPYRGVRRPVDSVANVYAALSCAGRNRTWIIDILYSFNRCLKTFSTLLEISVSRPRQWLQRSSRIRTSVRLDKTRSTTQPVHEGTLERRFESCCFHLYARLSSLLNPRCVMRKK